MKIIVLLAAVAVAVFLIARAAGKNRKKDTSGVHTVNSASSRLGVSETAEAEPEQTEACSPKVSALLEEGNSSVKEMKALFDSIEDPGVRGRIDEIIGITSRIMDECRKDESRIPQIKKFFSYYLPTTVKLLQSFERMEKTGIEGENVDKSLESIRNMLDVSAEAYSRRLDSLFKGEALDIETEIDVMNQMMTREGLIEQKGI